MRREYKDDIARCYADNLEAQVFSAYYSSMQKYKAEMSKCVENLKELVSKDVSFDSLMLTSVDLESINKQAVVLDLCDIDLEKYGLSQEYFNKNFDQSCCSVDEISEVQPKSGQNKNIRKVLEDAMDSIGIDEDDDLESFEMLEFNEKRDQQEIECEKQKFEKLSQEYFKKQEQLRLVRELFKKLEITEEWNIVEENMKSKT